MSSTLPANIFTWPLVWLVSPQFYFQCLDLSFKADPSPYISFPFYHYQLRPRTLLKRAEGSIQWVVVMARSSLWLKYLITTTWKIVGSSSMARFPLSFNPHFKSCLFVIVVLFSLVLIWETCSLHVIDLMGVWKIVHCGSILGSIWEWGSCEFDFLAWYSEDLYLILLGWFLVISSD